MGNMRSDLLKHAFKHTFRCSIKGKNKVLTRWKVNIYYDHLHSTTMNFLRQAFWQFLEVVYRTLKALLLMLAGFCSV